MTTYSYEYGQRWNAQLPRNDIRFLVHRMHSGTENEQVANEILARCESSGIPRHMWAACKRYALCVHNAQRSLYYRVLRGSLAALAACVLFAANTNACIPIKAQVESQNELAWSASGSMAVFNLQIDSLRSKREESFKIRVW